MNGVLMIQQNPASNNKKKALTLVNEVGASLNVSPAKSNHPFPH